MLSRLMFAFLVIAVDAGKVDDLLRECWRNRQFKRQCPYLLCLFTYKHPKKCMPV